MLTLRSLAALAPVAFLSGCNSVLMNPPGSVAAQQSRLIVQSTVLMLLIVIPVIVLTVVFAWRYRQSNKEATYTPDWDHSTQLELVIWAAPLLIIIALGALTWISSHTLDPFRPLRRLDSARAIPAQLKPLTIEVVALDWKWLFIYPEQGIATVNEVAAPVDVPINFKITASSVMNSFFVPALAGQVYAMPGMQTQLNAVMNSPGEYEGFSANYSGAGFSGMHFKFKGLAPQAFSQWVQSVKGSGQELSKERYQALAAPSEREPVHLYSSVDASLYDAILNQCVATSCLSAQASN
jgi:cytochrome o ubiquinol oxidase subunit II